MTDTLARLMEKNLLEVFGERNSEHRTRAIQEIYSEDCTFFEADQRITGRNAINAKVAALLDGAPEFVFRQAGPAQVSHDLGRLPWHFGPPDARPVVKGTDIALFEDGRIRSLYTFLDELQSE